MKTAKLRRRLRILRWVQRAMGLDGVSRITLEQKAYVIVTAVAIKESGMPKSYVEDILVKQMTWEMLKAGLALIEKEQHGDPIHDMEAWRATVKIIIP